MARKRAKIILILKLFFVLRNILNNLDFLNFNHVDYSPEDMHPKNLQLTANELVKVRNVHIKVI